MTVTAPNKNVLSQLVYQNELGKGSYKMVYSVVASNDKQEGKETDPMAVAIRSVRNKSEMKDALREISLVAQMQEPLQSPSSTAGPHSRFEEILDWWVTTEAPQQYHPGRAVFLEKSRNGLTSQQRPTSYKSFPFGSSPGRHSQYWVVVLKSLYAMDLKRFAGISNKQQAIVTMDNAGAWTLAYGMVNAGYQLHNNLRLVHRDIKPKNIMLRAVNMKHASRDSLSTDSPVVLIDFGFAGRGEIVPINGNGESEYCLVEPGKVKGEVGYVLAQDATQYRACQRGDVYAMGKTIWEVLFLPETNTLAPIPKTLKRTEQQSSSSASSSDSDDGSSSEDGNSSTSLSSSFSRKSLASQNIPENSGKVTIAPVSAQRINDDFRNTIYRARTPPSRFKMSNEATTILVTLVRGMCREVDPWSFETAQDYLLVNRNVFLAESKRR